MLKYKTRGDSSPQGKPRVYFCCHPDDFRRYFEDTSEDLLEKQDCAIWYPKDGNIQRDEQFFFDLKQMQLFVMPVTSKLLYTDNPALREEFPFAIANRIPVLPLMQEKGLEQLFNEKCGDLQFLDKYANDSTAISYDEKLEKYLNGVLVGDKLAEKIRAAFDAYVFLSYRKKDRKYAQELMQLIHKNDFCRDVAIWYDEFLTPGEDFNDAIQEALQKSGLFVLAVTPNVVNEPNYIMSTEYPMAKTAGKPILPVEMVSTDKKQLEDKYEGIPACADARDEASLVIALQDAVKGIALRENNSPVHNFFIGLAYLSGVDVEVDHDRAVSLITSAANAGLVEAIDKLVQMYRTGLGVELNFRIAIVWQEKKIVHLQKVFRDSQDDDALHNLYWCIIKCGDYYKEEGEREKAKEKYLQAADSATYGTVNAAVNRYIAEAYLKLGFTCMLKKEYSEAKVYYLRALAISKDWTNSTFSSSHRQTIAASYLKLGWLCKEEKDLKAAKTFFEQGLATRKSITKGGESDKTDWGLVSYYKGLGEIHLLEGDWENARNYFAQELALRKIIAKEMSCNSYKEDLAACYGNLGETYRNKNDFAQAKECLKQCIDIRRTIAEETLDPFDLQKLANGYSGLADVYKKTSDVFNAGNLYRQALSVLLGIIEAHHFYTIDQVPSVYRDIALNYYSLAQIMPAKVRLLFKNKERIENLQKAAEIYETLCRKEPFNESYKQKLFEIRTLLNT